jgi:ADP-dependent NAD(P)H-hydrate dehydratase / NAD(P)H-hydrate epimerase
MKIVDSEHMARIDAQAQSEYAMPAQILMENAGIKAYSVCRERFPSLKAGGPPMVCVAGSGNNGGDALVMARQAFLDGIDVQVLLVGETVSDTSRVNLNIARRLGIPSVSWRHDPAAARSALDGAGLIIDGMFGTGIRGPLRPEASELALAINRTKAHVVAIDLPSGIVDDYKRGSVAVVADLTICLGLPKRCLYLPEARLFCGDIHHLPIGFPPKLLSEADPWAELLVDGDIPTLLPKLHGDAFKSSRGRLAVYAGSSGTTGAPVLAASSAARSRCGLVYLFADDEIYHIVATQLVSVMVRRWKPDSEFDMSGYDAYLAGPGWGFEGRMRWLDALIKSGLPGIMDADALTLLAGIRPKPDLGGKVVLTPHPGEMARLTGMTISTIMEDPFSVARETSAAYNAVVVLKGHVTVVASPGGSCWVLDGVNPALGTGGSGDVLAGIIAGLLAGGVEVSVAARLGVLVHSRVARIVFQERGWFLAEDLVPAISKFFREVE